MSIEIGKYYLLSTGTIIRILSRELSAYMIQFSTDTVNPRTISAAYLDDLYEIGEIKECTEDEFLLNLIE